MDKDMFKRNNDKILELMKKKGIESIDDIESVLQDGFGNVLDILPKRPDIFEDLKMKESGESFNSCRARNGFDMVNHPKHYKAKNGMEVIDVIEAFTANLSGYEATHTGNVIKYICRWKEKNGLEDLKKAQWYLNRLIKNIEENK